PGVHRPGRGDARRDPGDGLHPLRRLRVGVPLHGGRPRVRGPGRPGEGLPLRGRPARRRARDAAARPRRGPARPLRLHSLLPVRRGLSEGRGPDEPDHATSPQGDGRLRDQGRQQRLRPREGVRGPDREVRHPLRGAAAAAFVRRRVARKGSAEPVGRQAAHEGAPDRDPRGARRQGLTEEGAPSPQAPRSEAGAPHLQRDRVAGRAHRAEPVHRWRDGRGRGRRMKLAYWPGCVSRGFTPELHGSVAKVAPLLDLELVELDRANCCGAGVIAEHNQELADTLNARTFALAQGVQGAAGMMNICSTCQGAQSECQERLDASTAYRTEVNKHLEPEGISFQAGGEWWNKNFLWILAEEIGFDALRERVRRPLTGLRIAPFYGCYIVRPSKRLGFDEHPERDVYLGQLIEALGAEEVEYAGARKCCGFPLITMNRTTSLRQAGRHLADAIDAGADCLVTPCPLCHLNLDMQQPAAQQFVERDLGIPVLHLPQMVGLAL